MNLQFFTARFAANAEAIERLVRDIDPECAVWKPAEDKWSIRDVVCHLVDEERLDFRTRIDYTLHRAGESWPPIDPEGWVTEHGYAQRDLGEQLMVFLAERHRSVEFVSSLASADWDAAYKHPHLGTITAGSLLGSWLAHDYLHIRQISKLYIGYLRQTVVPHSLSYAAPKLDF